MVSLCFGNINSLEKIVLSLLIKQFPWFLCPLGELYIIAQHDEEKRVAICCIVGIPGVYTWVPRNYQSMLRININGNYGPIFLNLAVHYSFRLM